MPSSELLHRVALVRTEDLEERNASFIKARRIGELGTLAVASIVFLRSVSRLIVTADVPRSPIIFTLMIEKLRSS
jgi:hypothetical protein